MDSDSSTAAASATDAFSLTPAAVTAFQSSKEEDEFVPLGLGTLLESLTLQDQASVSRQAAYEESLPFRIRCVSIRQYVSNRWVRVRRDSDTTHDSMPELVSDGEDEPDDDSDTTHDSLPELVSDGEDEPDDDSVTHDSMPELESHSNDEADDDSDTHESMSELARQSDDEREPNDDDNEDQVPQSHNVLPIQQKIGTVIQEMGYVPCGDLNEVDTTTEDDEEEDECEVQTEPIWIRHDNTFRLFPSIEPADRSYRLTPFIEAERE